MMKRFLSLSLAALLLLALTGCGMNNEDAWVPAGMQLASTDAVDYKLYVPSSWTVDVSTGIVSAYVSSTDRSNITMTAFNLEGEDVTMTPQEYWTRYEQQLLDTFPDLTYLDPSTILSSEETTTAPETSDEQEEAEPITDASQLDRKNNPVTTLLGDNQSAAKYYYTATVTGTLCQYMQVVCIRGGIVYLFTYSAVPSNFANHVEEVDSILANFSFAK